MTTQDFGWGTANFHKMGRKKIELIYLFTEMGFDILVSDVDTAWLRNPMPYLAKFPQADVLTSSDHLSNTAEGDSLEHPQKAMSAANIGIMLLRSSAKELAKQWVQVLEQDDKVWDQHAFNDLYRMGSSKGDFDKDRVFEGYNGKLKIGILPVATFASGHTYFVQRMHEKVKQDPYVIHATFQFSGTEGKRHRLREALVWADPPEYYDPPGGLLVYDADVPENLLKNATSVEGHFNLVNHQLLQVRSALALAQKLGRVLVMPKLYCGFDRWWAPHEGRIPGSQTTLPYLCPMDHVFEVESWLRPQPEEEFGDFIDFREYSFFDNDGVPESVKSSEVVVELVHSCSDGTCTQGTGGVAPADIKKVVAPKILLMSTRWSCCVSTTRRRLSGSVRWWGRLAVLSTMRTLRSSRAASKGTLPSGVARRRILGTSGTTWSLTWFRTLTVTCGRGTSRTRGCRRRGRRYKLSRV